LRGLSFKEFWLVTSTGYAIPACRGQAPFAERVLVGHINGIRHTCLQRASPLC
jgi:hypothetical protein